MTVWRRVALWAWVSVGFALALFGALHLAPLRHHTKELPAMTSFGVAEVGGPFDLINQRGERVSDRLVFSRASILIFGWTNDLDATPAALQVLKAAQASQPILRALQLVFVTLDPKRDTPERLSAYLASFDATMVGLTGTAAQIRDLAAAYKLYWRRFDDASLPGGYSVDFASLYYVMGAGGTFLGVVPYTTNVAELAEEIGKLLQK